MAVQIPVPEVSFAEIEVSLSGITYTLSYRFNTRFKKYDNDEGTWIVDILNSDREFVIKGLAVVGQGFLIGDIILDEFDHGDIICLRGKQTSQAPTRNNLGIDKDYSLVYLTNQEIEDALN